MEVIWPVKNAGPGNTRIPVVATVNARIPVITCIPMNLDGGMNGTEHSVVYYCNTKNSKQFFNSGVYSKSERNWKFFQPPYGYFP